MKIVFVLHDCELYGSTRSALDMAIELRVRGDESIFVVPGSGPLIKVLEEYKFQYYIVEVENWAVFRPFLYQNRNVSPNRFVRFIKIFGFFRRQHRAANQLKSELKDVDCIYSNSALVIFGFVLARRLQVKHIWHFREFVGQEYVFVFSGFIRRLIFRMNRNFVFSTQALKQYYSADTRGRGEIIPAAVGEAIINAGETSGALKLPGPEFIRFGMLGSINDNKGQFEIVCFFAELVQTEPRLCLLIAGDGDTSKIREYIGGHGLEEHILIYNYVPTATFFSAIDYLIVNSKFEGFGRVTIEAMKNRKLVIGRKSTGTYELIGDNQRGLLFENKEGFFRNMDNIVKGRIDIKEITDASYEWAKSNFSITQIVDKVLRLIAASKSKSSLN
ncbi:MAG TPA: glycosyltransferase family 4 protein [Chitinophagales bacterium]|nr:glycosyltransferase family 4 protein [Chitinophagales bacterium]